MPRPRKLPAYTHHKPTGQARVRIDGRDYWLGKHGTDQSRRRYERLIREWLGRQPDGPAQVTVETPLAPSVNHVLLAFLTHAQGYYQKDGRPTGELGSYRVVIRLAKRLYGELDAGDFSPLCLKACREAMIAQGYARRSVNQRTHRIKHIFRWATAEGLIPAPVFQALQAVEGLRRGRSEARETEPVRPVPEAYVDAVLNHVSRHVAAMIELQRLTGMRSGEVVLMRTCDLDTSGALWTYIPERHKTEHHGHERIVYLGPKAQAVVKPFLCLDTTAYLFSPAEAEAERNGERREKRQTPMSPSQAARQSKPNRRRAWKDRYDVNSYRRAIARAVEKANRERQEKGEPAIPHWHPHQIRHNAATRLRKELGIEMARCVLGHRSAAITEVYAELDRSKAAEAMLRLG